MPPKTRQSLESKQYSSNKRDTTSQKEAPLKKSNNFEPEPNLGEEHSQTPPATDETVTDIAKTTEKAGKSETNDEMNNNLASEGDKSSDPLENSGSNNKPIRGRQRNVSNNRISKGGDKKEVIKEQPVNPPWDEPTGSNKNAKNQQLDPASNPGSNSNQGLDGKTSPEKLDDNQQQEHVAENGGPGSDLQNPKTTSKPGLKQRPSKVSWVNRGNFDHGIGRYYFNIE